MANPPMSLARFIESDVVFDSLKLPTAPPVFSKVILCPFCTDRPMSIMEDKILQAEWFHCHGCNFAGDIIEFVMRLKQQCVKNAIDWLKDNSAVRPECPRSVLAAYETSHFQTRKKVNEYWGHVRYRAVNDIGPVGYEVGRAFWLQDAMYRPDRWGYYSDLFGVTELQRAESLFYASGVKRRTSQKGATGRRASGQSSRLFPKNSVTETICVPHFDLPGRIVGFTFVVEESNPNKPFPYDSFSFQTIYKRCNLGNSNAKIKEAGFGFLNSIDGRRHGLFVNTVFVFVNAVNAIRLHAVNRKSSLAMLPVLLATTASGFGNLHLPPDLWDKQIIVCGDLEQTIPIARRINADVSTYQPQDFEQELKKFYCPNVLLNKYRMEVKDWWTAFTGAIDKMEKSKAQKLVENLGV